MIKQNAHRMARLAILVLGAVMLTLIISSQFVLAGPAGQQDGPPDLDSVDAGLPGVPVDFTPLAPAQPGIPAATDATSPPTIIVWYGLEQTFGDPGVPQRWADILGRVGGGTISNLSYTLNGGPSIPLSIGPDNARLANTGDFHIELAIADLNAGTNVVVISATNQIGTTTETVIVNYVPGLTWPINTTVDWSTAGSVQDVAQVVDGLWTIENDKLVPVEVGYDRLVAIGQRSWTDYEVTVPVTVRALSGNLAGVGVILRWNGFQKISDEQPAGDWTDLGILAWNRWGFDNTGQPVSSLRMIGQGGNDVLNNRDKFMEFNVPYFMKVSVVSGSGSEAIYRMKVWEQSAVEPLQWDLEYTSPDDPAQPQSGSMVLVAHRAVVEFGNVEVRGLGSETYTLDVNSQGNGSVDVNPGAPNYSYGDQVALTAVPAPDHALARWEGDLDGRKSPITISMSRDTAITAVFVPEVFAPVNVDIVGQGTVIKSPNQSEYLVGEVLKLKAQPAAGYEFVKWSGDVDSTLNPYSFIVDGAKNITAEFKQVGAVARPLSDDFNRCELDNGEWRTLDPVGDSTFTMTGTHLQISVPAGVNHNLWVKPPRMENRAPRVFTPATNEDFEIQAKFQSEMTQRFQMQGILVQQDPDNFLRFDFFSDGTDTFVHMAAFRDGVVFGNTSQTKIDYADTLYMRVKREGNNFTQSYSLDGQTWMTATVYNKAIYVVSEVGLFAGNAGDNPAFTASIDYLFNTASPIVPGDGDGLSVQVDVNGTGSVDVSPPSQTYACGDTVTLTAIPGPEWLFQGWNGDLSGNRNPISTVLSGDLSVEAVFVPESVGVIYRNYVPYTSAD